MTRAYYNEIDPFAAAWLRELISAGHIAPGDVDTRSIVDVRPDDLRGYAQCHFFAGIGVWSYALRRAGWPDARPVWTGSCPCQPFSAAGKGLGFADERHLWPFWFHLIRECRPAIVFGEQVASKAVDPWIDLVQADMEGVDYAVGAVPFPSAGVGAPHIRDRTYWLADAECTGPAAGLPKTPGRHERHAEVAGDGRDRRTRPGSRGSGDVGLEHSAHAGGVADADSAGPCAGERDNTSARHGHPVDAARGHDRQGIPGPTNGVWRDADWLFCRDGKWRPVEPGTFPLAHGAPARVGRLRGYGNAINAEAAVAFIEAYLDAQSVRFVERVRLTEGVFA